MKLMKVTSPERVMEIISEQFSPLEAVEVELMEAGGKCLAEDIYSPEDLPGFNRSTVDGYAVSAQETFGASESIPALLECSGEIPMGQAAPSLDPGYCYQVHTGGMLPAGSDAVVMIEDTDITGDTVQIYRQVAPGQNVIHQGEDMAKGQLALSRGQTLRSPELGLLASMGVTHIKTYRQPVVGILSSGDELAHYHTSVLEAGKVRDSNAPALTFMGQQYGAKAIYGGILPDTYEEFQNESQKMLDKVDFMVLSGGSSVGTRDFTSRTLQELGEPGLLVEGISIQPGKPTLLANCGGKPVMGLPGHPVSALNIFFIFGKAILQVLSGLEVNQEVATIKAELNRNVPSKPGRTDYVRVKLDKDEEGTTVAAPVFGRSGMLRTLAEADGFTVIPPEKEGLATGETIEVQLWD